MSYKVYMEHGVYMKDVLHGRGDVLHRFVTFTWQTKGGGI